jgi:hypothetical protein
MSVHLDDITLLRRLIALVRVMTSRPHAAADYLGAVCEIEGDVVAAIRCPSPGRHVGAVEAILVASLKHLAGGHITTIAEALIVAHVAQRLLHIVGEHLSAAVLAATAGGSNGDHGG